MDKRIKAAALFLAVMVTAAVPLVSGSGGAAFKEPEEITAHAEGAYDKLAIELAGATAFDDARNAIKSADDPEAARAQFEENLALLTSGAHFGNVGIFVGPKGTSKNSDVWSVYQSKVTISNDQIQAYDSFTDNAFTKYKVFGGAVQKLNAKAQKAKGSANSVEKGLDELSAAGAKITNLGTTLISEYNPAPILLAFFQSDELDTHPDNKLVALVNANENLRKPIRFMGSSTKFGVPFTFLLLSFAVVFLLITSLLMTLINGRAAGENIRKAMVKFVLGCVAVPLIAKGLDAGVNFLNNASVAQAETPTSNYVEQNLNFADWYACGFGVPSGTAISINKNGEFVFSPEAVRAINTYTYRVVWGEENPTDKQMMDKMEEYYTMYKGMPMGVGFSEPVRKGQTRNWNTTNFYATLANFGENKVLNDGIELADGVDRPDLGNVGYYITNATNMEKAGSGWKITGSDTEHGVSPIAATNMMRTSFTGSAIVVNTNSVMGSVAFDVDNGIGAADSKMSPLTRFLATFAMVMAAMKGLFTIFSAGFAGIFSGGAKAMTGSSAGTGQAIGGAVGLLGGLFGISIIMTMSFTLLDQLYGVMQALLSGTTAGNDILEPFKEVVQDIPIIGPILGDMLKSVARFVLTILCALTLPKFGGIPVTLFCQHMAELPGRFAEKAQAIENKFTGDFRGGSGAAGNGLANALALGNQAINSGRDQANGMKEGLKTIAGVGAAYGLSKAGDKLADKYKDADTGEAGGSMAEGTEAEDMPEVSGAGADETAEAAAEAAMGTDSASEEAAQGETPDGDAHAENAERQPDGTQDTPAEDAQADAGATDMDAQTNVEGSMSSSTDVDGNDLKETEKDSVNGYAEGADTEISESEASMMSDSTVSEDTASEQMNSESSMDVENDQSEQQTEQAFMAEMSTMSTDDSLEQTSSESEASATMHSTDSMSMESHTETAPGADAKESMAQNAAGGAPSNEDLEDDSWKRMPYGPGGETERQSMASNARETSGTDSHADAPGRPSGMSYGQNVANRKALTKEQKHNRTMKAIAKGLQTAGGGTTKGQVAAGVLAGTVHMAGSAVGGHAQNLTGKGVNAVRGYHQMQSDLYRGLPAGYTRMQQNANKADAGGQNRQANAGTQAARPNANAARQSAVFAEALAREAEAQDARREAARQQSFEDAERRRRSQAAQRPTPSE